MDILFLTRSWHGTGGMQRFAQDLDRELRGVCGDAYHAVHPRSPGSLSLIEFCLASFRAARKLRPSHIHLGDASLLPLGIFLKRVSGARLSATVYGLDLLYPHRLYQWMLRKTIGRLDTIVSVSSATADILRARNIPSERIVVIPCGIRPPIVHAQARDPNLLLTVGRLIPRKGVAWFTEHVFPLIRARRPSARYAIVGDGPDASRIRSIIARQNLTAHVTLIAACDDAERDRLLSSACVFVAPNVHMRGTMEGFGIVCIEASARGLPVVAADIEGLKDAVIDGETGTFFRSADAEQCAQTVLAMMESPLSAERVSRSTLTHFDWSALIARYRNDVFR